jgi:sec-independent protein translocase protein TatC
VTLIGHLEELRTRLFIAIGAWVAGAGIMFAFRFELLDWLKAPLPGALTLHTFHLMEPFTVSMQIAGFFGLVLASPVVGGQIWGFVAPGLYPEERRWAVPFIFLTAFAFLCGVIFSRYVVLPFSIPIIVGFLGHEATMLLSTASYISTLLLLMGVFGLIFEMPVLGFLLARLGLINTKSLVQYRRHAILIGTILAAGITPTTDPVNLALVAVPLIVLYEITILVVRISERSENPQLSHSETGT